jgi:hypothetical protein
MADFEDQQISATLRKPTTIFSADVQGYSRLMALGRFLHGTRARWKVGQRVCPKMQKHTLPSPTRHWRLARAWSSETNLSSLGQRQRALRLSGSQRDSEAMRDHHCLR